MKEHKITCMTSIGTLSFYWSKGEGPVEPFKGLGKIHHNGWDITTHWVVDAVNVCWACNAQGPNLEPAHPNDVLELMDDPDQRNKFRQLFDLPAERAEAYGWTVRIVKDS